MGTWYTNEAAFLAAVNNEQSDTFNDLNGYYPNGDNALKRLSIDFVFQYTIAGAGIFILSGIYAADIDGVKTASTNGNSEDLILSVFNNDNCIGGIFNLSNFNTFQKESGSIAFSVSNGDTYNLNIDTVRSFFIGYVGGVSDNNLVLTGNPDAYNSCLGAEKIYIANVFAATPEIDVIPIESIENYGSEINLLSNLELEIQSSISSVEDFSNVLVQSENYVDPSTIDSTENITLHNLDLFIDPNSIITDENYGTDSNLYPDNFIDPINIGTDENIIIDKTLSDAFIYPYSITSQETITKQIIFPKPFPGTIQTWYEELHTIETELYLRTRS